FLDRNRSCSICFHNVTVRYEDESIEPHPFHIQEPIYRVSKRVPKSTSELADLVAGNFIQTCSVMFRWGLFSQVPPWYDRSPIGDWPIHIFNAQHGTIGYMNEIFAVYRVHEAAFWSQNLSHYRTFDDVKKMISL